MDIWRLQIFSRVVELGSFSKAAEAVNLSQPTVSSHVKDLEEHYGCRLIDRLGRQVAVTKGGELLYSFAQRILALNEETDAAMSAFLGRPTGRLSIGGSTIPGCYVLPKVIGAFSQKYPDVSVSLEIGDTSSIIRDVIDGKVEMGVVGAVSPDKQLFQEKLMDDQLALIVPAGHALAVKAQASIEELLGAPFVMREHGSGTRRFFEKILSKAGLNPEDLNITAQLGSTEAIREAIKAGLGVSVLSTRAVAEELKSGSLVSLSIKGLDFRRSFYLVRHQRRTPSPLCDYFCNFLKECNKE